MEIKVTRRFLKAYRKASPSLQGLAEGAIRDFVNRQRSSPKTVLQNYDRIANFPDQVIEIDLAGGPRLLANYTSDRLLLLDMGKHDVVKYYDINKFLVDIQDEAIAPEEFLPNSKRKFFIQLPDKTSPSIKYEEEISPEWLYFLEDEQQSVFEAIGTEFLNDNFRKKKIHFIMGGPGTGKTCILLNLLKYFVDLNFRVGIKISRDLVSYLRSSTQFDISPYLVSELMGSFDRQESDSLDLLLVDDPASLDEFTLRVYQNWSLFAVLAFDPLQLYDDYTDSYFDNLASEYMIQRHMLHVCYRQKEHVGRATKHVMDTIAASTPFLREDKIEAFRRQRSKIVQLSNEIRFVNPAGHVLYYPNFDINHLKREIRRILDNEWLMWQHWPGLLIILNDCELSQAEYDALSPLLKRNYVKIISFDQIEMIKGLEFQHVFIFIKRNLFDELHDGFRGSGQKTYTQRRLLRIPFSRAKDSLVVFALSEDE